MLLCRCLVPNWNNYVITVVFFLWLSVVFTVKWLLLVRRKQSILRIMITLRVREIQLQIMSKKSNISWYRVVLEDICTAPLMTGQLITVSVTLREDTVEFSLDIIHLWIQVTFKDGFEETAIQTSFHFPSLSLVLSCLAIECKPWKRLPLCPLDF